jgi:hypothetical protein
MARPPLAGDRLSETETGELKYRLKTPYSNGTTHILLSGHEMMERLIALIPPPRGHLTRYFGVLGPNSAFRDRVVPCQRPAFQGDSPPTVTTHQRRLMAEILKHTFGIDLNVCPVCGGAMLRLAIILNPRIARSILEAEAKAQVAEGDESATGPPVAAGL